MSKKYTVEPCGCGHPICQDYHVAPDAAVRGVTFSRVQAQAVAELLNMMEDAREIEAEGFVVTELKVTFSFTNGVS